MATVIGLMMPSSIAAMMSGLPCGGFRGRHADMEAPLAGVAVPAQLQWTPSVQTEESRRSWGPRSREGSAMRLWPLPKLKAMRRPSGVTRQPKPAVNSRGR